MKSGYKILWTDNALSELEQIYSYLEQNSTDKVLNKLSSDLDKTLRLISQNPRLFQISEYKNIRRVVLLKFNTLYYRVNEENKVIEILSFFSNRQNPSHKKMLTF